MMSEPYWNCAWMHFSGVKISFSLPRSGRKMISLSRISP